MQETVGEGGAGENKFENDAGEEKHVVERRGRVRGPEGKNMS